MNTTVKKVIIIIIIIKLPAHFLVSITVPGVTLSLPPSLRILLLMAPVY